MKPEQEAVLKIAQAVLEECKKTLREAYENAGMSGLCDEGRWEAAFGSLNSIDLKKTVAAALK